MEEFLPIPDLINIVNDYVLKPLPYIDDIHNMKWYDTQQYVSLSNQEWFYHWWDRGLLVRSIILSRIMISEESHEFVDEFKNNHEKYRISLYGPTCSCPPFQHICHHYS